MRWIEVLNEHDSQTCIGRQMLQQLAESFESTRGGADSYDAERLG